MRRSWVEVGLLAILPFLGPRGGGASAEAADAAPAAPPGPPARVVVDDRVSPAEDCSPTGTRHTLVVTVLDANGRPLPGQRVEWSVRRSPETVGTIFAADDLTSPGGSPTGPGAVADLDAAVSTTNAEEVSLDAASDWPYVDAQGRERPGFRLGPGQSWLTVISSVEGTTEILVRVPGIRGPSGSTLLARQVWADQAVTFPDDAEVVLPTSARDLAVNVRRGSDGAGLPDVTVEAEVLEGPEGVVVGGARTANARTDGGGNATLRLANPSGATGTSRVRLTARSVRAGGACRRSQVVATTWRRGIGGLTCTCACEPTTTHLGTPYTLVATVANEGPETLRNLRVQVVWPEGVRPRTQTTATLDELPSGRRDRFYFEGLPERPGRLVASVSATADGVAPAQASCEARVVKASLTVEILGPAQVVSGETATFAALVGNEGDAAARGVVLRVASPPGLPGGPAEVELGDLEPGATTTREWKATAGPAGRHVLVATATSPGNEARHEVTVETLGVTAVECTLGDQDVGGDDAAEVFRVGDEFLYVLEVVNGPARDPTPPLRATIDLPAGLELLSGTTDVGATVDAAGRTSEFVLEGGRRARVTWRVRVAALPAGGLARASTSVRRASDDAELCVESESTTVLERR